jgi:cytochrome c oxidase subunit 2
VGVSLLARATRRASAALLVVGLVTACASDGGDDLALTPEAADGREIARTNGCAACHGSDGEGGVGPAFVGLYGASVTLTDGTTVVADDAYLAESIRNPDAARAEGHALAMPDNDLDDDEIAAVIAFIRELSPEVSAP